MALVLVLGIQSLALAATGPLDEHRDKGDLVGRLVVLGAAGEQEVASIGASRKVRWQWPERSKLLWSRSFTPTAFCAPSGK